jgi:hypothetical protein
MDSDGQKVSSAMVSLKRFLTPVAMVFMLIDSIAPDESSLEVTAQIRMGSTGE